MADLIVYRDKHICVINKPVGMPSQSDPSGDLDAMKAASAGLTSFGECGKLWLIHRLDRNVGGLLVFARNRRLSFRAWFLRACLKSVT